MQINNLQNILLYIWIYQYMFISLSYTKGSSLKKYSKVAELDVVNREEAGLQQPVKTELQAVGGIVVLCR